jgi:hypothetical protein
VIEICRCVFDVEPRKEGFTAENKRVFMDMVRASCAIISWLFVLLFLSCFMPVNFTFIILMLLLDWVGSHHVDKNGGRLQESRGDRAASEDAGSFVPVS